MKINKLKTAAWITLFLGIMPYAFYIIVLILQSTGLCTHSEIPVFTSCFGSRLLGTFFTVVYVTAYYWGIFPIGPLFLIISGTLYFLAKRYEKTT